MSLRRKIALWLYPELVGTVEAQIDYRAVPFPHAQHMGSAIHQGERIIPAADSKALCEALKSSQHASEAAWKAEVLGHLKTISQAVISVTENGNAMRVINTR